MSTRDSDFKGPERIYKILLRLYPPAFRLRFGPEILQVFEDSYLHQPHGARLAFWCSTLVDLMCSLPGEWRQALIRPGAFELPLRRWADSLVIPFTVLGYLIVEGNLGAALVRTPPMFPWSHACSEAWMVACMVSTGLAIALTLAVLGIISAIITARNSRAEIWSIKLGQ